MEVNSLSNPISSSLMKKPPTLIRGRVGSKADLNMLTNRKILPLPGTKPRQYQVTLMIKPSQLRTLNFNSLTTEKLIWNSYILTKGAGIAQSV
jgi:hypothetical protein